MFVFCLINRRSVRMTESKSKVRRMKPRTDIAIPDRYVSMSNALARSAQGLSLSEKRVVSLALALTDSVSSKELIFSGKEGWSVKLNASDYAETYEVDLDTSYSQLKTAGKHLMKRTVRTLANSPRGLKEVETNWCAQCTYHHGEGWIEIAFTPQIAPHLLGLRSKFTSYKLKQASALRSIYSWRLFECLQSWKSKGAWVVELDEFQRLMDAPASLRKDFGRLRARVLEPALKELREKDRLIIDLELQRAGRKITGLTFRFREDPQLKLC